MPDMATGAVPDVSMTIPAGSRVYMPLFSYDVQRPVNTAPACLPYLIRGGEWVPVMGSSPPLCNPDGTSFTLPTIDDTTTATALILLCYQTKASYVVLQSTLLGGEMPWFDLPPGYTGDGSGGVPQ
ncbi:hypothetical protein [Paludibacterium denitrificans]|uniref:Uncharacterized protein n=1 Tax=Paludibacterium denitrificans TaxID=2675226 RepID=A0A844GDE9_9NEIS|nr:hypothetical protein [Paludibacterium denitrificans]MTD33679.1 hypothetical protein [Paludibacterium denitrificans]